MEQIACPSKGSHGFAGQPFGDCGARAEAAMRDALTTKMLGFLGAAAHSNPGNDCRRTPSAAAAADLADGLPEQRSQGSRSSRRRDQDRRCGRHYPQLRAMGRAMRHDEAGSRLANASARAPIPDRPRARRRGPGRSLAPRSDELRAGGHSLQAHRSPDGRSAIGRLGGAEGRSRSAGPILGACRRNVLPSPDFTTCRRRWR